MRTRTARVEAGNVPRPTVRVHSPLTYTYTYTYAYVYAYAYVKKGTTRNDPSNLNAPHDRARQDTDDRHHPAPDRRRVNHWRAAVDGVQHRASDRVRFAGEGRY